MKNAVILGDAAHAMVPFYGQGMNCGFEDVLILNELFDQNFGEDNVNQERIPHVLEQYSKVRNPDAEAICDLAMKNYVEMRSDVTKFGYLLRKKVILFNVD